MLTILLIWFIVGISFIANWKIPNFSEIQQRCYKRSKSFSFYDYEWFVSLERY